MTTAKPILLLHVGMPKTGTTSFQAQCQEHEAALRAGGLLYPRSARVERYPNHVLLAMELFRPMRGLARSRALRDLLAEIASSRCGRVLISGEEMSMLWRRPDLLTGLRSAFEESGVEVHVLMCRRPAESFVPALYGTLVRQGLGMRREEFERQARQTGQVTVPALPEWPKRTFCTDPDLLVRGFSEVFGPDRLHVIDYVPSGMTTRLVESQAWFFGEEASLFSDESRENVSGDADGRRRLEDLLAEAQGSTVWRSTAWVRSPVAREIRNRVGDVATRLLRRDGS